MSFSIISLFVIYIHTNIFLHTRRYFVTWAQSNHTKPNRMKTWMDKINVRSVRFFRALSHSFVSSFFLSFSPSSIRFLSLSAAVWHVSLLWMKNVVALGSLRPVCQPCLFASLSCHVYHYACMCVHSVCECCSNSTANLCPYLRILFVVSLVLSYRSLIAAAAITYFLYIAIYTFKLSMHIYIYSTAYTNWSTSSCIYDFMNASFFWPAPLARLYTACDTSSVTNSKHTE